MSDTKLSSDEVPAKFADWLLAMGCPPEKVPSVDKISQMCRGSYYLVWRSLMEQVESKEIIKRKRLQVFADDVRRCKKKNLFTDQDTNILIPPELTLWKQQTGVRRKVQDAETRVAEARGNLNEVMEKVSTKMAHRNLVRQRVQDLQRRNWLLQLLAEDLRSKRQALTETRSIAEDMCCIQGHTDVQPKLDRFLSSLRRSPAAAGVASSTMISTSVISNGEIDGENVTQLVQCRGDALWSELYGRRAALVASLSSRGDPEVDKHRPSFQTVLSETAALQCTFALEALKCREMTRLAQERLALAIDSLNSHLSGSCCELLVLRCERSRTAARVSALRELLADVGARAGLFAPPRTDRTPPLADIHRLDKAIESKRDELKGAICSLAVTERKIQNARDCLAAIFDGFRSDAPANINFGRGLQLDLPSESIPSLRRYYEQRRGRGKMELSMEFDVSDNSFNDLSDLSNARFIDELRIYLKKFNLEKNRKLVLESGEKIWIFETLQSSSHRLQARLQDAELSCALACPAVSPQRALRDVIQAIRERGRLKAVGGGGEFNITVDINKFADEEDKIIDNVKKRLDENLRTLQKTSKTLDQGIENLNLWSNNKIKEHILRQRTVDGKPYKAYEAYYLESFLN